MFPDLITFNDENFIPADDIISFSMAVPTHESYYVVSAITMNPHMKDVISTTLVISLHEESFAAREEFKKFLSEAHSMGQLVSYTTSTAVVTAYNEAVAKIEDEIGLTDLGLKFSELKAVEIYNMNSDDGEVQFISRRDKGEAQFISEILNALHPINFGGVRRLHFTESTK